MFLAIFIYIFFFFGGGGGRVGCERRIKLLWRGGVQSGVGVGEGGGSKVSGR